MYYTRKDEPAGVLNFYNINQLERKSLPDSNQSTSEMYSKDTYNGLHKLKKFRIITYPLLKGQPQFRISKSL